MFFKTFNWLKKHSNFNECIALDPSFSEGHNKEKIQEFFKKKKICWKKVAPDFMMCMHGSGVYDSHFSYFTGETDENVNNIILILSNIPSGCYAINKGIAKRVDIGKDLALLVEREFSEYKPKTDNTNNEPKPNEV